MVWPSAHAIRADEGLFPMGFRCGGTRLGAEIHQRPLLATAALVNTPKGLRTSLLHKFNSIHGESVEKRSLPKASK